MTVKLPDYSPLANGKDELLDVVRGLCMAIVITVHVGFAKINYMGTGLAIYVDSVWLDLVSWGLVFGLAFFPISGALSRRLSGVSLRHYWHRRAVRLLLPYYVFAVIMVPVELAIKHFGPAGNVCSNFNLKKIVTWIFPLHTDCLGLAQGPLWFLMTFLPIVLMAPIFLKVYDSKWRFRAIWIALGSLVLFDIGILTNTTTLHLDNLIGQSSPDGTVLLVMTVHMLVFWSLQFYFGFLYADGYTTKLQQKHRLLPLSVALMGVCTVLVVSGLYAHNPWGWWKGTCADASCDGNQFPATLAYMAGSVGAYLFLVWGRRGVVAFGRLPIVKPSVRWLSERSLTIMIWHMVGYEIVYWSLRGLGWMDEIESWPQWMQRPFFMALVVGVTVLLVWIFYPLERVTWFQPKPKAKPKGAPEVEPATS
ncbi:MAG: acyltransferase [Acidimicrobiia bacterium]|nr:acyltransferase [Acidimicrobiia bacterium]